VNVDLAEVIAEVRHQAGQDHQRRQPGAAELDRELGGHGTRAAVQESGPDGRLGTGDLRQDLLPRQAAHRELAVAIADVPGPPQKGSDEVLEVAAEVDRQRPRRVRQPRGDRPELPFVGVGLDLPAQRLQFAP